MVLLTLKAERIEREATQMKGELSIDDEEGGVRLGDTVLQMTRALGHSLISPIPDIVSLKLQAHHQVLILASDGVWDHLSEEDAVKIALENEEPAAAAQQLVELAIALNRDHRDQDNATALVVYFDLDESEP
jgi:serine/threonine protein phosphatase PrpC